VEPITFRNVCKTIAQYAFDTSDLPVIISLEVHCSIEQQKKMVDVSLSQLLC
jgi:Phosphatidylinositol-specific phospholipase C, X domain